MPDAPYLLYLDRYHMTDTVFLQRLARALSGRQGDAPPSLLIHGGGEVAERALESQGRFPEREGGVIDVAGPKEATIVERAVRQYNKKLVSMLTDEVVSAVSVEGTNRHVLRREGRGTVVVHEPGWLADLVEQGVVPVISTLAYDPEEARVREVYAAEAAARLAEALRGTVAFFTRTDQPGLSENGSDVETVLSDALPGDDVLPEPEAVRTVANTGTPVLLTNIEGLCRDPAPGGTAVAPSARDDRSRH